jgi:hypothetical protein
MIGAAFANCRTVWYNSLAKYIAKEKVRVE